YVEVPEDEDQQGIYLPIQSSFNSSSKTVSAKITDWALGNNNIKLKIALVSVFDIAIENESPNEPSLLTATATEQDFRDLTLPPESPVINQSFRGYPCPLTQCIEISRMGLR